MLRVLFQYSSFTPGTGERFDLFICHRPTKRGFYNTLLAGSSTTVFVLRDHVPLPTCSSSSIFEQSDWVYLSHRVSSIHSINLLEPQTESSRIACVGRARAANQVGF